MIDSEEATDSAIDIIYNPIDCWNYLEQMAQTYRWLYLENGKATVEECMALLIKNWIEERAKLEAYLIWQREYVSTSEMEREGIQCFVDNYSFEEFIEYVHERDSKDEQYARETAEERSVREAFTEDYYKTYLASGKADAQSDMAFYETQLEALKECHELESAAESDWSRRLLLKLARLAPYYF